MAMFNGWTMLKLPEGSLSWSNVALGKFVVGVPVASCQLIFADLGNFPADWLPSCNSGLHEFAEFAQGECDFSVGSFTICSMFLLLWWPSANQLEHHQWCSTVGNSGDVLRYILGQRCMHARICWMLQWEWRRLQIPPCEDSTWQDCLELR